MGAEMALVPNGGAGLDTHTTLGHHRIHLKPPKSHPRAAFKRRLREPAATCSALHGY